MTGNIQYYQKNGGTDIKANLTGYIQYYKKNVPPNEVLEGTLHPPKNVPPDEKTCGHADHNHIYSDSVSCEQLKAVDILSKEEGHVCPTNPLTKKTTNKRKIYKYSTTLRYQQ